MNISVVIPAYKNKELFLKILSHNLQFLQDCELVVVNDDPSESLHDDLQIFKNIKLIENKTNLGFGATVNKGVDHTSKDYILLLNTDVKLKDDSFKKALEKIQKDASIFAISFAQEEKDKNIVGKNRIFWKDGYFQHSKGRNLESGINGWAEGGSCLIDKKKFQQLYGFDPVYSPFYWEDVDLSYRAWKTGYKILFDSSILVEHHHESTIGKYFKNDFVETISYRNQFIFIWKNITDWNFLISHILTTFKLNFIYTVTGKNKNFRKGLTQAFYLLPKILEKRNTIRKKIHLSDEKIIKMFYE